MYLLVARLLCEKGVREDYHAAAIVKKRYPHVRFLLAGDIDPNLNSVSQTELDVWMSEGVIEYLGRLADVCNGSNRQDKKRYRFKKFPSPRLLLSCQRQGFFHNK